MSIAARLISGTAASWMRMGVIMISQLVLVPLYLNYWTVDMYGIWLAIQALVAIMTMIDLGHQTYLGYEFLRLANTNRKDLGTNLWSGIGAGILIGLLQIIIIVGFIYTNTLPGLLGVSDSSDQNLINAASITLLLQGIAWLIASSTGGLFVRALEPFGYYPRLAWWGVFLEVVKNVAPAVTVVFGGDLLDAGIALSVATLVFNVPIYLDMFYLMRKQEIKFTPPSARLGFKNFTRSLAVAGKLLLENARQQGVRLVLAPLAGAASLAAFSTMRTGSNVALQGLNTITNPLMPDLMRFLHNRDQPRIEAAFGTVWVVLIVLMGPAVVTLQVFVAPLFSLWTQGQIEFNPTLFAILSLTVLVYALAQPAMAVVMGNNLMKPQLLLSVLAAVVVIAGILALVPLIGISGAGVALLGAEIIASLGYVFFARKWMHRESLVWPTRSFAIAATSVVIVALSMSGMILFPDAKWLIFAMTVLLFGWTIRQYWLVLPKLVTDRVLNFASSFPPIRKFFQSNL